jgi:hypothetical protein
MAPKLHNFDPTTGDFGLLVKLIMTKHKIRVSMPVKVIIHHGRRLLKSVNHWLDQFRPGGQGDNCHLARINFNRQATKFVDWWLANGRGKQEQEHAAD